MSPYYHGTRVRLRPGDAVSPQDGPVSLTEDLDAAIWAAELADGVGEPTVYEVLPRGTVEDPTPLPGHQSPPHPAMSLRSNAPLVVVRSVERWAHYHGTRAELGPGDLIEPGHSANFGPTPRRANYVYFTRTLDAAIWGAELASGEGVGRVYVVEPTGSFEDDPNLTDKRFRGNPTKSFRSRSPLRVVEEFVDWKGHAPELVRAMKDGLARLEREGVEPDDS